MRLMSQKLAKVHLPHLMERNTGMYTSITFSDYNMIGNGSVWILLFIHKELKVMLNKQVVRVVKLDNGRFQKYSRKYFLKVDWVWGSHTLSK